MSNKKLFSRISLWWTDTDDFKYELSYPTSGKSIATLKTVIALAHESDFFSREVKISYSELEELTGLSRPMISNSIKWLIEKAWIKLISNSQGRTNVYELLEESEDNHSWTKLPYKPVAENLKTLPNKGNKALTALKNYLMILKYRPNKEDVMKINHTTLIEKNNLRPELVKGGNDLLLTSNFIGLGRYVAKNGVIYTTPNLYHIKGLYYGKKGIEQQSHAEWDKKLNVLSLDIEGYLEDVPF